MRRPLVAGNWKLNGSKETVLELINGIKSGMGAVKTAEVAVCPPYVYIPMVAEMLDGSAIELGGQDVSDKASGAFTGEISGDMLRDFDCKYTLVGHSERRSLYQESDEFTADKFVAAQSAGLVPILCVGELLEEREAGTTEQVVGRQLDAVLDKAGIGAFAEAVIAYEPVWAIGTGKTATPQQAQDVHAFIRGKLAGLDASVAERIQILYGGSVNGGNAAELFRNPDIDGGLIGGASLKAEDFLAICTAQDQH